MTILVVVFWASLVCVVHSYIVYPLIVAAWAALKTSRATPTLSELPRVSLMMSVYNEEHVIREKLANLVAVQYPEEKLEILIGSDGSTDSTEALVRESALPNVTLTSFDRRRGKAAVLNDLVSKATGEILLFSDANTFYAPDAVRNLVRHFGEKEVGGVCGNLRLKAAVRNSGGKGEAAYWQYENVIKQCEGKIRTTFGATGGIYALRRNLYRMLPTKKAITDDFLLPLYAVMEGYRMLYDPDAIGWEETTPSTVREFQRKARIGAQNFNGIVEIRSLLHPRHGFISFGLISHKLIRWFIPILLLLIFISSIFLVPLGGIYTGYFIAQCVFLGMAVLGWYLDRHSKPVLLFTMPYYFLVANAALLTGFFRFLRGSQMTAWSPTRT